jgi:hypothetical protein
VLHYCSLTRLLLLLLLLLPRASCTANLEEIYDWVREDVGGTIYNPATMSLDPLFYFHHSMVDFLLWLWQINFPDEAEELFVSVEEYVPFKNDTSDARAFGPDAIFDPEDMDYYYEQSSTGSLWHDGEEGDGADEEEDAKRRKLFGTVGGIDGACQQRKHRRKLAQQQRQRQLQQVAEDAGAVTTEGAAVSAAAAVTKKAATAPKLGQRKQQHKPGSADPKSAAAQASLRDFVKRLQKDYSGYRYQARLMDVDCNAEQEPWVIVALLKPDGTAGATGSSGNWRALRQQQNACAFWSAQSCKQGLGKASVNLDLTQCLKNNGRNPDQAPKDVAHPENGPANIPVTLDQLEFRALLRDKDVDVSEKVGIAKAPAAITWAWVFDQAGSAAQGGDKGEGGAIAAAAAAQGLAEVPKPAELYVTSVVAAANGTPQVVKTKNRPALFGRSGGVVEYEVGGSRKRLL